MDFLFLAAIAALTVAAIALVKGCAVLEHKK
jgi:hypothetical protein